MKKIILYISFSLFVVSLTQVAYCTPNLCRSSLDAFLTGTLGMFYGGAALVWLANPFLFISWILIKRKPKFVLPFSGLATLIGLSFMLISGIVDNEAGHVNKIIELKVGYYIWILSMISTLIYAIINRSGHIKQ